MRSQTNCENDRWDVDQNYERATLRKKNTKSAKIISFFIFSCLHWIRPSSNDYFVWIFFFLLSWSTQRTIYTAKEKIIKKADAFCLDYLNLE